MSTGLILFAHGARDARWREPFDRLAALVTQHHPGPVSLAFLEAMSPDLTQAAIALAAAGAERITIVPLFLGEVYQGIVTEAERGRAPLRRTA